MEIKKKRVVFIDLDDTLIKPIKGDVFPKGIWDMQFKFDVFDRLKRLKPMTIIVVSNQGGIESGLVIKEMFEAKFMYVLASLQEYVGKYTFVCGKFCTAIDKSDSYRKPNPGMLKAALEEFNRTNFLHLGKEDCIMIGDASGLEDNFSDSDKKVAENFGCDYLDVREFVQLQINNPLFKVVSPVTKDIWIHDGNVMSGLTESEAVDFCKQLQKDSGTKCLAVPVHFVCPDVPAAMIKSTPNGMDVKG